ncbi:MAG TPA: hypothetical protein VMW43_07525 [Bacteroidota bacterium]|nr:hypothetical protein [Bacteroidota bacterium]
MNYVMCGAVCLLLAISVISAQTHSPAWMDATLRQMEGELAAKYGEGQRSRIQRGLRQVADFWRAEDGDAAVLTDLIRSNFAGDQAALDVMFKRYESNLEQLAGHLHEINREFRNQSDLDLGPIEPYDEIFGAWDPGAHVTDDFFQNKLAFVALLNFPLTSLQERLANGDSWTRRQWAETRLADWFSKRIPADVNLALAEAGAAAEQYISEYNIWMHHLLDEKGERLFPPKLRLLSHWNLRDELKADYSEGEKGIRKQRMIAKVMERIVTQTIPVVVINNPHVDWNPYTNTVTAAAVQDDESPAPAGMKISSDPEPDTRYEVLLKTFLAEKKVDPYSPTAPTHIARRFDEDRQIPEARVHDMLTRILSSPLVARTGRLIESRLGRPLEPFDVWYNGFRNRGSYTEEQLDQIVARKYPTPEAYRTDIPRLLRDLGFSPEKAAYVAGNIIVDPARGSGHAMGAGMRSEKAHLRTRVGSAGMNYKGYNIAVHEMGHNVEQTFSLNEIDYYSLSSVPNTAFTEALAFVFQGHDLELLGLTKPDDKSRALKTLDDFWGAYEIAGVALVDMGIWHWMYDHPQATPREVKEATLAIARDIWNAYYAPVFHQKDVVLLGIYSHMIDSFMYLPDYPIGHMIAFQVEEAMNKAGAIGPEFERITKTGRVTPDQWMKTATGKPVGPDALLNAATDALNSIGNGN